MFFCNDEENDDFFPNIWEMLTWEFLNETQSWFKDYLQTLWMLYVSTRWQGLQVNSLKKCQKV